MTEPPVKKRNRSSKNEESSKADRQAINNQLSRKQPRKGENPARLTPATAQSQEVKSSDTWVCRNSACRASLPSADTFCTRCSCCICHLFDDNKDPSLWLVCTAESDNLKLCGMSCHIECAIQKRKVGVINHEQLDGSYSCASCGRVSDILGWVICLLRCF